MSIYKSNFSINKIKDDIIDGVIFDIVSDAKSDIEKASAKASLEGKIKKSKVITSINDSAVEIKSSDLNRVSGEIYIDLLTTFGVLNLNCEDITRYKTSQSATINSLKSKIRELKDRLESSRSSLSSSSIPEFIIERFRNANRFDKNNRIMQRDRYGQYFPRKCLVNYDADQCILTLPYIRQDNSLKYDEKVETATASLRFQLGEGFVDLANKSSDLDIMLNSNNDTWSETILSDAPLRTSFMDVKPPEVYIDDNYFYGVDNGAVCELEIKFESINTVNQISIKPFCKYPVDIIAIRYKMTDDEDEPLTEIVFPDNKDEVLKGVFTKDKVSFRFPDIICKNIYILFVQRHYTRETYIYNPSSVYKDALWFNSKNDISEKNTMAVYKPRYHNRSVSNYAWQQVNEKVVSSSDDLVKILIGDESKNRKVTKYEYNYGFYNIGCFNNHFDRTGFYVSKEIELQSNVKKIEIFTDEVHQLDSNQNQVTDIEYYITGAKNPSPSEWIPVMPKNKRVIESELLMIQGGTRAYFRFETNEVIAIMKNGVALPENSPEYHIDTNERTGNYWSVLIFNYDYDAVYSVKYVPIEGSDYIDLSNKVTTSVESFKINEDSFVVLENQPCIDDTDNYCNVTLTDLSSNLESKIIHARNVTDVINPSVSYENFDNQTSEYQFYVLNNMVYFNKPIPENFIVDITYRHLITKIVSKAIFRRNSVKDGWLTPELKEIKYKIETY